MSTVSPSREVVERPVERLVSQLKAVFFEEIPLRLQQLRLDEGQDRALDGTSARVERRRLVGVRRHELFFVPRKDGARRQLVRDRVDLRAASHDALARDLGQLFLQTLGRNRLAAKAPSPNRAAAEREVQTRIVASRQDRLLDLL